MTRKAANLPSGLLPRSSITRGAAGDRGGGCTPPIGSGQAFHGRPEPPGSQQYATVIRHVERVHFGACSLRGWIEPRHGSPPGRGQPHGDPPGNRKTLRHLPLGGSPPMDGQRGGSPPGRLPWQSRGDPPGISVGRGRCDTRGDPPREARSFAKHTYGCLSGPIRGTSSVGLSKASWLFQGATGPPGAKLKNPVNSQSPPGEWASGSAPPGFYYQTRGDPPGGWTNSDPPGTLEPERSGRAPPGVCHKQRRGPPGSSHFNSTSLSAGRRRGLLLVTQPEAVRQEAVRQHKPKSRKIKPWL